MAGDDGGAGSFFRTLAGALGAGTGLIAVAGGLVWSNVEGWSAPAIVLVGGGAAAGVLSLIANRRVVFYTARGVAGVNAALSVLLAVIAFGLVSYINHRAIRGALDLTRTHRYSLSEATRRVLAGLARTVEVTVILSPEEESEARADLGEEVVDLVGEYERHGGGRVAGRVWGVVEDESRILQFYRELGLDRTDVDWPVVVVRCGRAHKHLAGPDFVAAAGGEEPVFRGEEVLTNAILEVIEPVKRKVYFTRGHGEGEIDLHTRRGFTEVRGALVKENLEPLTVNLERARSVPPDCSLLAVLAPARRFTRGEIAAVRSYLDTGGRLFVLLDSAIETREEPAGLRELLRPWGIELLGGMVFDRGRNYRDDPAWTWVDRYGEHAIVSGLEGSPAVFVLPRGMRVRPDPPAGPGGRPRHTASLMATSRDSWCETELKPPATRAELRPGPNDIKGPLVIGAAAWEVAGRPAPKPGARVVVLGDASFLSNRNLRRFSFCAPVHLDLFRNAVNWLLEREARIPISPREYRGRRRLTPLDISDRSIRLILWGGMMGMPLLVLLLGVAVWLLRRR